MIPLYGGACDGAYRGVRASADLQVVRKSNDFAKGPPPRMRKPLVAPVLRGCPGMKAFCNVLYVCPVYCFARRAR